MKAKLEYRAVVAVDVDLETDEVESVIVRAATDDDERVDLTVSIDSDEEQPDEVYDRGHQIVDAAAPFELSGWWAPSPEQRWAPVVEADGDEPEDEVEEAPVRLRKPPAKEIGTPPPYALAYQDDLPASHREALRQAAIGWYLPRRYDHYYDGRFARVWIAAVTVVGWKLAQPTTVTLACVAEELALWALVKQAQVQLEIAGEESDARAWSDFRDAAFKDEDFLWLHSPELDGIEESDWGREHAVVNLRFSEWFKPFSVDAAARYIPSTSTNPKRPPASGRSRAGHHTACLCGLAGAAPTGCSGPPFTASAPVRSPPGRPELRPGRRRLRFTEHLPATEGSQLSSPPRLHTACTRRTSQRRGRSRSGKPVYSASCIRLAAY